jgi:hypothetical protein
MLKYEGHKGNLPIYRIILDGDEGEGRTRRRRAPCDHAVGLTGWGALWYISDGEFPVGDRLRNTFAYCPFCGASLAGLRQETMETE